MTCPANNGKIIQKSLAFIRIYQNEAFSPSCNLQEMRVTHLGILVVCGVNVCLCVYVVVYFSMQLQKQLFLRKW